MHHSIYFYNVQNWVDFRASQVKAYIMGRRTEAFLWKLDTDWFLFDLILYVTSTIFQSCRDGSSWVEPVLS